LLNFVFLVGSEFRKEVMHSAASQPQRGHRLLDSGLKQLELLFHAIVYQLAEPILIVDDERNYWDASCGAGTLFGLSRDRIIGWVSFRWSAPARTTRTIPLLARPREIACTPQR
jgi:hypothetical protein